MTRWVYRFLRKLTRAMQYSLGFSFSSPYFSRASTTAKSAVSLVERRMVLYGILGFRLSAYILKVPPAETECVSSVSLNTVSHLVLVLLQ